MTPEEATTHGGWFAAAGAALTGLAIGVRKAWLAWKADGAAGVEIEARQALVAQLHAELTRLGAQNLTLATELNKLQLHILELTKQIGALTTENTALRSQVEAMEVMVAKLTGQGRTQP